MKITIKGLVYFARKTAIINEQENHSSKENTMETTFAKIKAKDLITFVWTCDESTINGIKVTCKCRNENWHKDLTVKGKSFHVVNHESNENCDFKTLSSLVRSFNMAMHDVNNTAIIVDQGVGTYQRFACFSISIEDANQIKKLTR